MNSWKDKNDDDLLANQRKDHFHNALISNTIVTRDKHENERPDADGDVDLRFRNDCVRDLEKYENVIVKTK